MYPAAWVAAADMLVEALSGAQLVSLEQVRRRVLRQGVVRRKLGACR
jgi:hypothetical protein